jgi:hypothetical protein
MNKNLLRISLAVCLTFSSAFSYAANACIDWSKVGECKVDPEKNPACLTPLPENVSDEGKRWAIKFDFDRDGCLPSSAISPTGVVNEGIAHRGSLDGHCAYQDQLNYANTYYRKLCVFHKATLNIQADQRYCAHIYALYFVKDQVVPGLDAFGHTNDWEFGIVWTTNDDANRVDDHTKITHASYSAHGKVHTQSVHDIYYEPSPIDRNIANAILMVYHKDGGSTHAMRFATEKDEPPENPTCEWVTPALLEWDKMTEDFQQKLTDHNFGSANLPIKDANFLNNITASIPDGYPSAEEWEDAWNDRNNNQ